MKCLLLIWERTDIRCWIRLLLSNINVGGPWRIVVMWFCCTIILDYTMFSWSWQSWCYDAATIVNCEDWGWVVGWQWDQCHNWDKEETMMETCSQEYEEDWHGDTLSKDDGHLIISVIIYLWSYFKLSVADHLLCSALSYEDVTAGWWMDHNNKNCGVFQTILHK